jgi:hypothetical protein
MSTPASALPKSLPFSDTSKLAVQLAVLPGVAQRAGVTATGEKALAGLDWTKPKPLPSSAGIRLRSETSLHSMTSRMAARASSRLAPSGTSPTMTAISPSRSQPQAASASGNVLARGQEPVRAALVHQRIGPEAGGHLGAARLAHQLRRDSHRPSRPAH